MKMDTLWEVALGSPVASCPGIVDNGETRLVIVGTDSGEVLALDGEGKERWRDRAGGVLQGWPATVELSEGTAVIIGDHLGSVHAYSADGTVLWRTSLGQLAKSELFNSGISPWSGVARLDGPQPAALVATDRGGQVTALTADGKILWQAHFAENGICAPAVGDIDGDGVDEIVVSGVDGRVHCLAADGSRRWETEILAPEGGYHAPLMVDWGDGPRILLLGRQESEFRALDAEGREVWRHAGDGGVGIQIGIAPLLVEGNYRFFVAYDHTGQEIISPSGEALWHGSYASGNQPFGPSVADIDGDGKLEILLTRRGNPTLWVLGADGEEIASLDMGGTMDGAPVIADLNDDGVPEFLVVDTSSGRMRAYRVRDARPGGTVLWPTSRGSFDGRRNLLKHYSAAARAESPARPKAKLRREKPEAFATGRQPLHFAMPEQAPPDAVLSVEVIGPDQIRHLFTPRLRDAEHGRIDAFEQGVYRLSARLHGEKGDTLAESAEEVHFTPFRLENDRAKRLLDDLNDLLHEVRKSDDAAGASLARQVRDMSAQLNEILARVDDAGENRNELVAEMRARLRAAESLLARQKRAHEYRLSAGGPVEMLLWSPEHPWASFSTTEVPTGALLQKVRATTERRAHDAVVIAVANVTPDPLTVRVWWDSWEGTDHPPRHSALTVRKQVTVPTAQGNMAPDALPELDEAGLVTIPAGRSARIWLDFAAEDAAPGSYTTQVHVRALTVAGQVWDVPVAWDVLPLALPERSPLAFHVWAYENKTFFADLDLVYRDLIEHYVNVFDLPLPRALYRPDGSLDDLDWSATDRAIERVPSGSFFLWSAQEQVTAPAPGAPPVGSPAWDRAFRAFVPRLVAHLAERGVDYDHHANYILDEPGIEGGRRVERFLRVAKLFKAADPQVKIFCNPAGGATREHIEQLLDVSDILDPIWLYPGEYTHLRRILERAPVVWTYACGQGAKDHRRMRYYWAPIWKGAEIGLTGIGFWSYAGRSVDFWQGTTPSGCDWELVYPGNGTVVPSHRWLGLRIGIEDYMRLWMVSQKAGALRESGRGAQADHLEKRRAELLRTVVDSDIDEGVIGKVREELRTLLLAE